MGLTKAAVLASAALGMLSGVCGAGTAEDLSRAGPQHDFDFELGRWSTEVRRLKQLLSHSTEWLTYSGTTTIRGVLGNRANIAELEISGPAGRLEGASLRLYEPESQEWTLNYFNVRQGQLTSPVKGHFSSGRGVFYGADSVGGQAVQVRFIIERVSDDEYHFEQAFSPDSGRTWEVNWIATDKRQVGWTPCPALR